MPQTFHPAEGERGVLAEEDHGQHGARPARQLDSAENGLEGAPHLGARTGAQEYEPPAATDSSNDRGMKPLLQGWAARH